MAGEKEFDFVVNFRMYKESRDIRGYFRPGSSKHICRWKSNYLFVCSMEGFKCIQNVLYNCTDTVYTVGSKIMRPQFFFFLSFTVKMTKQVVDILNLK